jgi:hypothetical protein
MPQIGEEEDGTTPIEGSPMQEDPTLNKDALTQMTDVTSVAATNAGPETATS